MLNCLSAKPLWNRVENATSVLWTTMERCKVVMLYNILDCAVAVPTKCKAHPCWPRISCPREELQWCHRGRSSDDLLSTSHYVWSRTSPDMAIYEWHFRLISLVALMPSHATTTWRGHSPASTTRRIVPNNVLLQRLAQRDSEPDAMNIMLSTA